MGFVNPFMIYADRCAKGTEVFMKNYKMIVAYDGTRYRGWQIQKNTDATIQGKLSMVLGNLAGHTVEVIGSGSTSRSCETPYKSAPNRLRNTRFCDIPVLKWIKS